MEFFDPLLGPRTLTQKFNPNHDDKGRFSPADGNKDSLDDPKAKPLTPEARDARIKFLEEKMHFNTALPDRQDIASERDALVRAREKDLADPAYQKAHGLGNRGEKINSSAMEYHAQFMKKLPNLPNAKLQDEIQQLEDAKHNFNWVGMEKLEAGKAELAKRGLPPVKETGKPMLTPTHTDSGDAYLFRSATELEGMRKDVARQLDEIGTPNKNPERWKALDKQMDALQEAIENKKPETEFDTKGHVKDSSGNTHETTNNGGDSTSHEPIPTVTHTESTQDSLPNSVGAVDDELEKIRVAVQNRGIPTGTYENKEQKDRWDALHERRAALTSPEPKVDHEHPDQGTFLDMVKEYGSEEDLLKSAPMKPVEETDVQGGTSEVRVMDLGGGKQGVFKPASGENYGLRASYITHGYAVPREVAAWEVAKQVGMTDMVAPVVSRSYKGKIGSMAEYIDGETHQSDGDVSAKELGKAAMFDYVIGNLDRHGGNWMVSNDDGHVKLIDHNLAFPDVTGAHLKKIPEYTNTDFIIAEMRHERNNDDDYGDVTDYAKPFIDAEPKIEAALKNTGLPSGAIEGVTARIEYLKTASKWTDLYRG